MKISKPYKRIIRPFESCGNYFSLPMYYQEDIRYADDMMESIRAYKIIEADLVKLFEYIDPTNNNLGTYSYRTYELFLRAATEFEAISKKILQDNIYKGKSNDWNIIDFWKINNAYKLSEYQIFLNPGSKINKIELRPFSEWSTHDYTPLKWYQDYNSVKHNRQENFSKANLGNLLNAVAGVFSILYGQFYAFVFSNNIPDVYHVIDKSGFEMGSTNSIFSIKLPQSWEESEMYEFNWEELKKDPEPFQKFDFNK